MKSFLIILDTVPIMIDKKNKLLAAMYALFLAYFIFKMVFYAVMVGRMPDEPAHVSYVAYLQQTDRLIPDFRDMMLLGCDMSLKKCPAEECRWTDRLNYLCHPPLYYQIMRLANGVRMREDGSFRIDIISLKLLNGILVTLAMILVLGTGYRRIRGNYAVHLLYAAICTCVPMVAYLGGAVNNDNLALLGLTLFTIGALRFFDRVRTLSTYLTTGFGFFTAVLSKSTAAEITVLALAGMVIYILATEKSARFIICREGIVTLPLYLVPALYYAYIYSQYGTLQPTLHSLRPDQFVTSFFYVEPAGRITMSFPRYAFYYAEAFLKTWSGIASHILVVKPNVLVQGFAFISLWLIMGAAVVTAGFGIIKKKLPTGSIALVMIVLGVCITVLTQFIWAYGGFSRYGYPGNIHSRYYLCAILPITLLVVQYIEEIAAQLFNEANRKRFVYVLCVVLSCFMVYQDFIYFVINFDDYL